MATNAEPAVTPWQSPPEDLTLPKDEVHVWRACLDLSRQETLRLSALLSPDETRRAERFHFDKDRRRFAAGRGILRSLLGRYLSMEPRDVRFSYGPEGKPELAEGTSGTGLRFNVSHSHGMALFAFTRGRDIGVDLEQIRADKANEQIARRFFSAREVEALAAVPEAGRVRAFFDCWSRKEAFIKGKGKGLSIPLSQFAVSLAPGEPPALLSTEWEPREASRWLLRELDVAPDYASAMAVQGHHWRLKCWDWPSA